MNKYYRIVFRSAYAVSQEIFVMTTETDSVATLQNFVQDAFSSYQENAVRVNRTSSFGEPTEYDDLTPDECEELDEEIRNSCYVAFIKQVDEKATELINALDSKNAKRKETGTKNQKANLEIKEQILTALENGEIETLENENGENFITSKTVAKFMQTTDENFFTQKAAALLGQLEKDGKLICEQVKSRSGKVKGYRLNTETETE